MWIWLHNYKGPPPRVSGSSPTIMPVKRNFPKIWSIISIPPMPLPSGRKHNSGYGDYYDGFPVGYVLDYPINSFRIYVNNKAYFNSGLPSLDITTKENVLWDVEESYYRSLIGTWLATYACGISKQHLTFSDDVPKQITSLIRFHLINSLNVFMGIK